MKSKKEVTFLRACVYAYMHNVCICSLDECANVHIIGIDHKEEDILYVEYLMRFRCSGDPQWRVRVSSDSAPPRRQNPNGHQVAEWIHPAREPSTVLDEAPDVAVVCDTVRKMVQALNVMPLDAV